MAHLIYRYFQVRHIYAINVQSTTWLVLLILGYVANLKKLKSEKSLVVVPAPALPRASPRALWSHFVWEEAVVLLGPLCHNRKGVFNTRQTTGGFPVKLRRLSQQVLLKQVSIE